MPTPKPSPSTSSRVTTRGSRKRTKTFTGCWTCRARRIKCDEAKPSCKQCQNKCIECEGYGIRLQWLAPEIPDQAPPRSEIPSPPRHALRREIPADPPKIVLSWDHVDGIIRELDSLDPNSDPRDGRQPNDKSICTVLENFGVFALEQFDPPDPLDHLHENGDPIHSHASASIDVGLDFATESISGFLEPLSEPFDSPSCSETAAAWDLCNLQAKQLPLHPLNFAEHRGDIANVVAIDHAFSQPSQCVSLLDKESTKKPAPESLQQLIPPGFRSFSPNAVPQQDRFLMCHYMNKVVNLFCVIDNSKSPWKTIHLPRVLQGAGELSFSGETTRIRNALRNALLSISAFYMSNDLFSQHKKDDGRKWAMIASRYRYGAIGLLKEGVELDLYNKERPKYKEFLATMLSMITINVMSGDTSTCGVHLDGAEQLILHTTGRRSHFSRKAHALHRIYLYLRVIYESTSIKPVKGHESRFSSFFNSYATTRPQPSGGPGCPSLEHDLSHASNTPLEPESMDVQDPTAEMVAYECIYGIPQGLLIMLKEAIDLIDMVEEERQKTKRVHLSESLDQVCDHLEREILDWPLDQRLEKCCEANPGVSASIIYHQTRAFHNALIIYFSQSVRLLGHRYLRHYVETILDSIEAIERIKAETKILAAPLFWPAFIGATEAFEPQHQERFRQWYSNVAVYGIEAVRTGVQVLGEVWRQGPTATGQLVSSWRRIVAGTGESLMLT